MGEASSFAGVNKDTRLYVDQPTERAKSGQKRNLPLGAPASAS